MVSKIQHFAFLSGHPFITSNIDLHISLIFISSLHEIKYTSCNRHSKQIDFIFRAEENDFEKLQEDFVLKLVDADPPHQYTSLPPPPNLTVPGQDKWFYQDPQVSI